MRFNSSSKMCIWFTILSSDASNPALNLGLNYIQWQRVTQAKCCVGKKKFLLLILNLVYFHFIECPLILVPSDRKSRSSLSTLSLLFVIYTLISFLIWCLFKKAEKLTGQFISSLFQRINTYNWASILCPCRAYYPFLRSYNGLLFLYKHLPVAKPESLHLVLI